MDVTVFSVVVPCESSPCCSCWPWGAETCQSPDVAKPRLRLSPALGRPQAPPGAPSAQPAAAPGLAVAAAQRKQLALAALLLPRVAVARQVAPTPLRPVVCQTRARPVPAACLPNRSIRPIHVRRRLPGIATASAERQPRHAPPTTTVARTAPRLRARVLCSPRGPTARAAPAMASVTDWWLRLEPAPKQRGSLEPTSDSVAARPPARPAPACSTALSFPESPRAAWRPARSGSIPPRMLVGSTTRAPRWLALVAR